MCSKYKVEKNIPMPSAKTKYPFADMEIGDSFLVVCDKDVEFGQYYEEPRIVQNRVSTLALRWAASQGNDFKFSTRTVSNGFRVWRVK